MEAPTSPVLAPCASRRSPALRGEREHARDLCRAARPHDDESRAAAVAPALLVAAELVRLRDHRVRDPAAPTARAPHARDRLGSCVPARSTCAHYPRARRACARDAQNRRSGTLAGQRGLETRLEEDLSREDADEGAAPGERPRACRAELRPPRLHHGRSPREGPRRRRALCRHRRRPLPRDPLGHAAHRRGDRQRAPADRDRGLLHRHEPGRPRGRDDARHPRLQRPVLEHPLGRGADPGRDRLPAARDPGEERAAAPRRLAKGGRRGARGSRPHARHRGLRQHRLAALGDGRSARHERPLPRPRDEAAARQRRAGRSRSTTCSRPRTSSPCTSPTRPRLAG